MSLPVLLVLFFLTEGAQLTEEPAQGTAEETADLGDIADVEGNPAPALAAESTSSKAVEDIILANEAETAVVPDVTLARHEDGWKEGTSCGGANGTWQCSKLPCVEELCLPRPYNLRGIEVKNNAPSGVGEFNVLALNGEHWTRVGTFDMPAGVSRTFPLDVMTDRILVEATTYHGERVEVSEVKLHGVPVTLESMALPTKGMQLDTTKKWGSATEKEDDPNCPAIAKKEAHRLEDVVMWASGQGSCNCVHLVVPARRHKAEQLRKAEAAESARQNSTNSTSKILSALRSEHKVDSKVMEGSIGLDSLETLRQAEDENKTAVPRAVPSSGGNEYSSLGPLAPGSLTPSSFLPTSVKVRSACSALTCLAGALAGGLSEPCVAKLRPLCLRLKQESPSCDVACDGTQKGQCMVVTMPVEGHLPDVV